MIQTIRMHHVLREAVATPYRNLVTRPTGVAVRSRIEDTLERSGCPCALLDFSEVELLDFSCADEIVAKLLLAAAPGLERYVVLRGLTDDQREAIEHVLVHHGLAVAMMPADQDEPRLLGWVPPDGHDAFAQLCERGASTADDLAGELSWPAARALAALDELVRNRLARQADGLYHPLPTL